MRADQIAKLRIVVVPIILVPLFLAMVYISSGSASSTTYSDEFTATALDAKWTWINPLSDCGYDLSANPGHLRISVPSGNHDLYTYSNLNAPRITQSISGDFTIETRVLFDPSYGAQCAGILVWKDSDNYLRLDRVYAGVGGGVMQAVDLSGEYLDSWHYYGSAAYANTTTYLRLERTGCNFTASYSSDGVSWTFLDTASFPGLEDPVQIGLFVLDEWQNNPIHADFDYFKVETPDLPSRPVAVAGTSLDGNNMLQLDGTLSNDPNVDPLTFNWQIDPLNGTGQTETRTGQVASIADLPVGNYQVTLTVSNGTLSDTDTMLLGIPAAVGGEEPPPTDILQEQVENTKDKISNYQDNSFDAPNDKAAENRRKALLNMLDKVSEHIETGDYQAAIDQLQDILAKSDGLSPADSAPDWIIDDPATEANEQEEVATIVSHLINNLQALL